MTLKLEIPNDDLTALYHIGEALRNIALTEGFMAANVDPVTTDQDKAFEAIVKGENLGKSTAGTATDQDGSTKSSGPNVDVDSEDLPWDKRINPKSKLKNSDGKWKMQRKPLAKTDVEWDLYVNTVKSELRQLMSVTVTPTPPTNDDTPTPPTNDDTPTPPTNDDTPTPPTNDDTPTPPTNDEPMTFGQLMKFITSNRTILSKEVVDAVLEGQGVAKLPLLASKPDLIPQVYADLEAML